MIRFIALPFVLVLLTAADCSQTLERTITQVTTGKPPVQFAAFVEPGFTEALEDEPVAEIVPPPVYERVCWIEWHRAGTMAVEVCEDRLVLP